MNSKERIEELEDQLVRARRKDMLWYALGFLFMVIIIVIVIFAHSQGAVCLKNPVQYGLDAIEKQVNKSIECSCNAIGANSNPVFICSKGGQSYCNALLNLSK